MSQSSVRGEGEGPRPRWRWGSPGVRTPAGLSQNGSLWGGGGGQGAGWNSSCPELGDRKGLRAKQRKGQVPLSRGFRGLVPAVGEEAEVGLMASVSQPPVLGLPCSQT